jgi:hypothetical protein
VQLIANVRQYGLWSEGMRKFASAPFYEVCNFNDKSPLSNSPQEQALVRLVQPQHLHQRWVWEWASISLQQPVLDPHKEQPDLALLLLITQVM